MIPHPSFFIQFKLILYSYKVQEGICAVKGTGKEMDLVIGESMEWLVDRINANYSVIDKGVTAALKVLRERQAQDRLERQHRLAEIRYDHNFLPFQLLSRNLFTQSIFNSTHPTSCFLKHFRFSHFQRLQNWRT